MNDLKHIISILDMDGYQINKTFHCKELGIFTIGETYATSYQFDLGVPWHTFSTKDQKSCRYVMQNIHHLPFKVPSGTSAINLAHFPSITQTFHD